MGERNERVFHEGEKMMMWWGFLQELMEATDQSGDLEMAIGNEVA